MSSVRIFELEDLPWYPAMWRDLMTDFLAMMCRALRPYRNVIPILRRLLDSSKEKMIIDIGSGGGGPIDSVLADFDVSVTLTDKFPNRKAFEYLQGRYGSRVSSLLESIDAASVPETLRGVRTLFTFFHHLPPEVAKEVLCDAVRNSAPIGIFEITGKRVVNFLSILFVPFFVLFLTPFIRPWSWSRLLWTYIIPIVPIAATWDGFASNLRTYSREEMQNFIASANAPHYHWEQGTFHLHGIPLGTYCIGYPVK